MLDKIDKAFADLILMGWDATTAYRLLHPNSIAKGDSMKVQASRLKTSDEVEEYLKKRGAELTLDNFKVNPDSDESLPPTTLSIEGVELEDDFLTRKNQIKRYKLIMDTTKEDRVKIACLEAINKLMGYHKDKPENGEQVIFYLPLRCCDCRLFREEEEKNRKERTKQIKQHEV